MEEKNRWLSASLVLVVLCTMLLAPSGWGIIPSAMAGGPGTIQLTATASGQSIVLNWSAASDTPGLSGYYIYRGTSSGGESSLPLNDFPVTQTTYTDTTVSSGTYYYFVKPVYDDGSTTGPPSNEASATVGAASSGVTIILRVGQPTMTVNGEVREIDPGKGTAPALVSGRVFLPISSIVQAMGGHTTWDGAEKKVSIYLGTTTIDLWIGRSSARVNGVTKSLDAVPFISATGRTMLPLRFVAENLGCQLQWESASQKVTISYSAGAVSGFTGVPATPATSLDITGVPDSSSQPGVGVSAGPSLFSGIWKVTDDRGGNWYMYLVQSGNQLTGNWSDQEVITGTINGNKFNGKYYKGGNPGMKWNVNMTVTPDGQGFTGSYSYSTWTSFMVGIQDNAATDKINISPTPGAPDADFSGTWDIWLYQPMVLTQSGDQVSGTWGDKTVTGVVTGNVLNGKYYKTSDPTLFWGFNMKINADGESVTGWHTLRGGKEFTGKKK